MSRTGAGFLVVALGAVAYDLCSYLSMTRRAPHGLAAALALLPALIALLGLTWRTRWRLAGGLAACAAGLALVRGWSMLEDHAALIFLCQQLSMWGLLMFMFARTLRQGRTPLCTGWADLLHGPLSSAELRYTRAVTLAWAIFCAAMALTGLLLYACAPASAWAAFNNLWTLPLLALMFVGEYIVRHRMLPDTAHVGLFEALRLYAASRR
ncbi:MAG: hypothetical protein U1F35_07695 [Steroidobacteraceae bacterium]